MWPPEDDVEPVRSWDELVAGSRRRGTRLRRRRRAALGVPALALAGVLALPYTALLSGPGTDALVTDTAEQPEVVPGPQGPEARGPQRPTLGDQAAPRRPAQPAPAPRASREEPQPRTPAPLAAAPRPAPAAPRTAPQGPPATEGSRVVAFEDEAGDGYTHLDPDGTVRTSSSSSPARDILAVRFVAERDGVHVTMELAGDRDVDDDHYAFVTDARSGCQMDIAFGSQGIEGYYAQCPDGFASPFVEVPHLEDPSPHQLVIFVPYALFPRQMDPSRPLSGLEAQTRRRHNLQGQFRGDTASSPLVLAGRPA